jgi:hypothetical protein
MYHKSTIFFFLLLSTFSFGQNFKLIHPNRDYYFDPLDLSNQISLAGISIDSTTASVSDSIFYSYKCMNKHGVYPSFGCYDIQDTGFIGEKFLVRNTSETVFFNDEEDSILFKPQAALNSTWRMMDLDSGKFIQAKVNSIDTLFHFGFYDSLKVITLQTYNSANMAIPHLFNNYQFHISKQFGFIKTSSLLRFPKDSMSYHLKGITNPDYGVKNITLHDIFNFNVNDTMQYFEQSQAIGNYWARKWTQKNMLSKYESANHDTLVYDIERFEFSNTIINMVSYTNYIHDTTKTFYLVSDDFQFNKRPNEYSGNFNWGGSFDESYPAADDTSYNFRNKKRFDGYSTYDSLNHCLIDLGGWCSTPHTSFAEGLGYIGTAYTAGFCSREKMTYFHKGTETWGTPFNWSVILATNDLSQTIPLIVKPNPFESEINIEFLTSSSDKINIFISNSLGQMVFEKTFNATSQISIPTEKFANGLYFLSLFSACKVYRQKLVKY